MAAGPHQCLAMGPSVLTARRRRKRRFRKKKRAPKPKVTPKKAVAPEPSPRPTPTAEPAAAAPAPPAQSEEDPAKRFGDKPGVAMMEIAAMHGVEPSLAALLGGNLNTAFQDSGRFGGVISSADVQAMLSHEQQAQALGCDDTSCIAALGGALGVPLLVVPSLGRAGGRFILNLKVIAVEEAETVARLTRLYKNEASLVSEMESVGSGLASMIFGEKSNLPALPPLIQDEVKSQMPQYLGAGMALVGTVSFVSSYFIANASQSTFDNTANKDSQAVDALLGNQTMVTGLWGGGLLLGLSGAGLLSWGLMQ